MTRRRRRERPPRPTRGLFRRIIDWYKPSDEEEKDHLVGFIFTMMGLAIISAIFDRESRDWLFIPFLPVVWALFWPVWRWMFLGARRSRDTEDF